MRNLDPQSQEAARVVRSVLTEVLTGVERERHASRPYRVRFASLGRALVAQVFEVGPNGVQRRVALFRLDARKLRWS